MKTKPHNMGLHWPGCLLVLQRKTLLGLGISSLQMERKESKTLFTGEIPTQLWESRHSMPLIPTKFTRWCYPCKLNGIQSCDYYTIMWLTPNHNIIDIGMTHFILNIVSFSGPFKITKLPVVGFDNLLHNLPQHLYKIPSVSIQFSS